MEFRTPVHLSPSEYKLGLQSNLLTVGSCFADAMGSRMQQNKLSALVNPFGTLFNPVSISRVLSMAMGMEEVSMERAVSVNNAWYHYDFHSRLVANSANELQRQLEQQIQQTSEFLKSTDFLLLTLGTSVVYQLQTDLQVVANCHKVPAQHFHQRILSLAEVLSPLEILFSELQKQLPSLKIILTVSPVRHIKDTLPINSLSKALLRVACHQLTTQFESVEYFPAYEMLIDDLRDYRFYKPDMIHPSEVAEEYIWQQFVKTYADEPAQHFFQHWHKIRQALAHKPFQEQSQAHLQFLKNLEQKLVSLAHSADVSAELEEVRNRIHLFNV